MPIDDSVAGKQLLDGLKEARDPRYPILSLAHEVAKTASLLEGNLAKPNHVAASAAGYRAAVNTAEGLYPGLVTLTNAKEFGNC